MRTLKGVTAVGGLAAAAAMGLVASSSAQTSAPAPVHHPCPSGMVCIYRGVTDTSKIQRGLYILGASNVHIGPQKHLVINQLWDKRTMTFRSKHNGKGHLIAVIPAGQHKKIDFTKVRSVVLEKKCPVKTCFTKVPQ